MLGCVRDNSMQQSISDETWWWSMGDNTTEERATPRTYTDE
jgi:hypothetical protein